MEQRACSRRTTADVGPRIRPYDPPVSPILIAAVLGAGLLALLPTRRLAQRSSDGWVVTGYYMALWLLLIAIVFVPPIRRLAIPLALLIAVAPWLTIRDGLRRVFGLSRPARRAPPRNVTPPDGGPTTR